MMWLTKLLGALTGGGFSAVDGILGRFFTDKDAREANIHGEVGQVLGSYAAEFTANRGNRTWWDSLVDGLNRLVRPGAAFAVLGLMFWAPWDPIGFSQAMRAYALVPEWLAVCLTAIMGFYFTARHLEKRLEFKPPEMAVVRSAMTDMGSLDRLRPSPLPANPVVDEMKTPMDEVAYASAMADEKTPLSTDALAEWNRRHGR